MARPDPEPIERPPSTALVAIFAWVLPGLGHWWIGHRARGVIFFVVTTVTFWAGIAVGGVRGTVTTGENGAWVAAQLCMGPQAIVALRISAELKKRPDQALLKADWPASNIGVVYAGIAGLLNLLIIVDVLARAEARRAAVLAARPAPKGKR
ncbi:MAG: DUF6677 family protein [Planctomycetota bacterium]